MTQFAPSGVVRSVVSHVLVVGLNFFLLRPFYLAWMFFQILYIILVLPSTLSAHRARIVYQTVSMPY